MADGFQARAAANYELSILTGMGSSAYLVCDDQQRLLAFRSFEHDPKSTFWESDPRLKLAYKNTRIGWRGHVLTFVPGRLYSPTHRRDYLTQLTDFEESQEALADHLSFLNVVGVYGIDRNRLNRLRDAFPGCKLHHAASSTLNSLLKHATMQDRPGIYASVSEADIRLFGLDRQQLLYCNAFRCAAARDYLYYTLLAYEQCGWKPEEVPLYLFGELLADGEIYRLLYRYINQIEFLAPPAHMQFIAPFDREPLHLFHDLVSLQLYA